MKRNISYYLALIFAIWFMLTSFLWAYWLNVVVSFPFAFLSWYLLKRSKEKRSNYYKVVIIILTLGILSAVISLVFFTK